MTNPAHIQQSDGKVETNQPVISFFRSFVGHPASVGETYFGHLAFALRFAFRLFVASGAALIHAFIPALFETTASRQVRLIHDEMTNRHSHPQSD